MRNEQETAASIGSELKTSSPAEGARGLREGTLVRSSNTLPRSDGASPTNARSGVEPYLAKRSASGGTIRQARASGSFEITEACVVFTIVGRDTYTPIFPSDTEFKVEEGRARKLVVGERVIRPGQVYRVTGGQIPTDAATSYNLAQPIPTGCPSKVFLIGEITS